MKDDEIIELYWKRDEDAIIETSNKYGKYCKYIAFNILGNTEDTEESVNDTYMHTWNAIPPNRPRVLRTWLGRITRNISIDKYKFNNAKKRSQNEVDILLSELDDCIPANSNIEKEIEDQEIAKVLNDFLSNLSQEKRIIFVRRYYFSDSVVQISKRYNLSESRIKSSLFRIRKELKKFMEKEGVVNEWR